MSQSALHLYVDSQFSSLYALSAFVALTEKNLDFQLHTVDLAARAQHAAGYAALSLTRRVPTLQHGDFALSESSAISEYLDEQFAGRALYPAAPQLRARARQLQAWLRSDLQLLRQERGSDVIFAAARKAALTPAAQEAASKLFSIADALLPDAAANLFGDWSIADLDLAATLNRLVLHGDAVPERLAHYARQQWQRPAVQRWLALAAQARHSRAA
ncbi:glutathione transferase [Vogesella sp. GCM10023246]|uniref:Glutathione transferase n=1 Tax=Vogesella oryzagri TaxID=3160864 RepID=A0ABV1M7D3_9NEIS